MKFFKYIATKLSVLAILAMLVSFSVLGEQRLFEPQRSELIVKEAKPQNATFYFNAYKSSNVKSINGFASFTFTSLLKASNNLEQRRYQFYFSNSFQLKEQRFQAIVSLPQKLSSEDDHYLIA